MPQVKKERTGWRDLALNGRHRRWGWDCPMVDIDFFLEFDNGKPCALIEYKADGAQAIDFYGKNIEAQRILADRAEIPFFIVKYNKSFEWFAIRPVNTYARTVLLINSVSQRKRITEEKYVGFLYALRGRQLPTNIFRNGVLAA